MANSLTEADMADHRVIYQDPCKGTRNIRAAYITTEDKHPDMLAFKDHRNRTVLLVSRESVLAVERLEPECDEARTEISEGGFETTSQAMRRAGIEPEDVL